MSVSEATENYLETIYIISRKQSEVHAADICAYLDYSRPTVSVVVHQLQDDGYLSIDALNHITLTEAGREVAEAMYERHQVLAYILEVLGVDEEIALKDACKVEHDLSKESFDCIKAHYQIMKRNKKQ